MQVVWWTLAVAGTLIFTFSLVPLIRANPNTKLPYWRGPSAGRTPRISIALRSIGAGLQIFGLTMLAPAYGFWIVLALTPMLMLSFGVLAAHNRRVKQYAV